MTRVTVYAKLNDEEPVELGWTEVPDLAAVPELLRGIADVWEAGE